MSQEQAAEQQPSEKQVIAQIGALRDAIVRAAVDNKLSFEVIFNAMSQATSQFIYDLVLSTQGELTDASVANVVAKFNSQMEAVSKVGLENMREYARAEAEAAAPKIITEV